MLNPFKKLDFGEKATEAGFSVVSGARALLSWGARAVSGGLPSLPVNTVAPSIGTLETGILATASPGTWTGADTVTGAWFLDGSQVATGYTYTPPSAAAALGVFFRETATNGAGSETADSATVTPLYNPVVVSGVNRWLTLRRDVGLVADDSVDPLNEVIGGFDLTPPSGVQAPVYVEQGANPAPAAQFDGIDDLVQDTVKSNYNFLHQGPSTMFFLLNDDYNSSQYLWTSGSISANSTGIAILLTSSDVRFYVTNGTGDHIMVLDHTVFLVDGVRSLCFAQDLTDARLYIDGVLADTVAVTGSPAYSSGDSFNNPRLSNTSLHFDGQVLDAVFANQKLDAADILSIHNNLT